MAARPGEGGPARVTLRPRLGLALVATALLLVLGGAMGADCNPASLIPDPASARPDEALDAQFTRSGPGWTGADSTYSVRLPDGRTLWLFSDTFLGTVRPDRSRPRDSPMVNNTLVVQDGRNLVTLHGGTPEQPAAFFTPSQAGSWYWLYDATVDDGALYVFLIRFRKAGDGPFGFEWQGTDLARLSLPDLRVQSVQPVPSAGGIAWGSALLEDGDLIYVYGVEDLGDRKYSHLARARRGALAGPWEYLGEQGWSDDPAASRRLLAGIGNEHSVTRVGAGYLLVTMDTSVRLGADLVAYAACSPEGPWEHKTVVYRTPENKDEIHTYNAHAHPELSEDGQLLISYNVNSLSLPALFVNADFYRPRFIRVRVPALAR